MFLFYITWYIIYLKLKYYLIIIDSITNTPLSFKPTHIKKKNVLVEWPNKGYAQMFDAILTLRHM